MSRLPIASTGDTTGSPSEILQVAERGKGRFRRAFIRWACFLAFVWIIANLPRNGGTLKSWMYWMGFPWTFAAWDRGFDFSMLIADILVGVVFIGAIAALCAWSRCRGSRE